MTKWRSFGQHRKKIKKKSTATLYKEMKKLEKKERDAQERAMIQKRIYELKHKRRIAITNRMKVLGNQALKTATSEKSKKKIRKLLK